MDIFANLYLKMSNRRNCTDELYYDKESIAALLSEQE
jgi:hypothetical protein